MSKKQKKYVQYGAVILALLILIPAVNMFRVYQSGDIFLHQLTEEHGEYDLAFNWRTGPALVIKHWEGGGMLDIPQAIMDGHMSFFGLKPVHYELTRREAYEKQDAEICEEIVFCKRQRERCMRLHEHGVQTSADRCNEEL